MIKFVGPFLSRQSTTFAELIISGLLLQFCRICIKHALHEVIHILLFHGPIITVVQICSCQEDAVAGNVAGIDAGNTS